MSDHILTDRQRAILEFLEETMRERGYPPSVREIGAAVGLNSPSTVHSHLAQLEAAGYLRRDPTKPRAIEVCFDASSGAIAERRPTRHVPLVGDVAAGTDVLAQENVEELMPVPEDFTGDGELFMLRVRGESMIDAGILDGDFVVVRRQDTAANGDRSSAPNGDRSTAANGDRSSASNGDRSTNEHANLNRNPIADGDAISNCNVNPAANRDTDPQPDTAACFRRETPS